MRAAGIPVAEWARSCGAQRGRQVSRAAASHVAKAGPTEGSSVGVFIVREDHAHPPQELTDPAWSHGEELLAERFIPGRELTCAVMGDRILGVIEIVPAELLSCFYN